SPYIAPLSDVPIPASVSDGVCLSARASAATASRLRATASAIAVGCAFIASNMWNGWPARALDGSIIDCDFDGTSGNPRVRVATVGVEPTSPKNPIIIKEQVDRKTPRSSLL